MLETELSFDLYWKVINIKANANYKSIVYIVTKHNLWY